MLTELLTLVDGRSLIVLIGISMVGGITLQYVVGRWGADARDRRAASRQ